MTINAAASLLREEVTALARDSYNQGRKDALASVIEAITEAYGTTGAVSVHHLLGMLRAAKDMP